METLLIEPPPPVKPAIDAAFLVRSLFSRPPLLSPPSCSPARCQSYSALRNLTFLISLLACALQVQGFMVSQHGPGRIGSPDFFNTLQTLFMQLLTTYTSLIPAIRNQTLRGFHSGFWIALLCISCLVLNIASVAVFFSDVALGQLLSFFGTVVQAVTVLQLALRVDYRTAVEADLG